MVKRLVDPTARKKWMRRIADSEGVSDARCRSCNERAPLKPITSRGSDTGLLVQMWRCVGGSNQWITSTTRVTS